MRLLRTLNPDNLPPAALETLKLRQAARAIVFDDQQNIALLHVEKGGYYKLPGGGVEDGEDLIAALKRECLEELGCRVAVERELGFIIEYRGTHNLKQESYGCIAQLVGTKGIPSFTKKERADGFTVVRVPLYRAIDLVSQANIEDDQGRFIVPRELVFLREAEALLGTASDKRMTASKKEASDLSIDISS
jgi:8-oxo-dGTP pyrophosphatase MutT (NUDIX family)